MNLIKYQIKVLCLCQDVNIWSSFLQSSLSVQSHQHTFDQQQVNIYKCVFAEQEAAELLFCYQAAAQTLISSFTVQDFECVKCVFVLDFLWRISVRNQTKKNSFNSPGWVDNMNCIYLPLTDMFFLLCTEPAAKTHKLIDIFWW